MVSFPPAITIAGSVEAEWVASRAGDGSRTLRRSPSPAPLKRFDGGKVSTFKFTLRRSPSPAPLKHVGVDILDAEYALPPAITIAGSVEASRTLLGASFVDVPSGDHHRRLR